MNFLESFFSMVNNTKTSNQKFARQDRAMLESNLSGLAAVKQGRGRTMSPAFVLNILGMSLAFGWNAINSRQVSFVFETALPEF